MRLQCPFLSYFLPAKPSLNSVLGLEGHFTSSWLVGGFHWPWVFSFSLRLRRGTAEIRHTANICWLDLIYGSFSVKSDFTILPGTAYWLLIAGKFNTANKNDFHNSRQAIWGSPLRLLPFAGYSSIYFGEASLHFISTYKSSGIRQLNNSTSGNRCWKIPKCTQNCYHHDVIRV